MAPRLSSSCTQTRATSANSSSQGATSATRKPDPYVNGHDVAGSGSHLQWPPRSMGRAPCKTQLSCTNPRLFIRALWGLALSLGENQIANHFATFSNVLHGLVIVHSDAVQVLHVFCHPLSLCLQAHMFFFFLKLPDAAQVVSSKMSPLFFLPFPRKLLFFVQILSHAADVRRQFVVVLGCPLLSCARLGAPAPALPPLLIFPPAGRSSTCCPSSFVAAGSQGLRCAAGGPLGEGESLGIFLSPRSPRNGPHGFLHRSPFKTAPVPCVLTGSCRALVPATLSASVKSKLLAHTLAKLLGVTVHTFVICICRPAVSSAPVISVCASNPSPSATLPARGRGAPSRS